MRTVVQKRVLKLGVYIRVHGHNLKLHIQWPALYLTRLVFDVFSAFKSWLYHELTGLLKACVLQWTAYLRLESLLPVLLCGPVFLQWTVTLLRYHFLSLWQCQPLLKAHFVAKSPTHLFVVMYHHPQGVGQKWMLWARREGSADCPFSHLPTSKLPVLSVHSLD